VFFIFDLLHLDGEDVAARPLIERKARLAALLSGVAPPLHYSDYHRGQRPLFVAPRLRHWSRLRFWSLIRRQPPLPCASGRRRTMTKLS
jgi:bifunctional non-homologous end joining protein LigD